MAERRTARRFNIRLPLSVRVNGGSQLAVQDTESQDVSSRGVYFYLPKEVKNGSNIELVMTLPHEVTLAGPVRVKCMGRVQRTEKRGEERVGVVAAIERYEFLREEH
jgi:hypothetical protein